MIDLFSKELIKRMTFGELERFVRAGQNLRNWDRLSIGGLERLEYAEERLAEWAQDRREATCPDA